MRIPGFLRRQASDDCRGDQISSFLGLATVWEGTTQLAWRKCKQCSAGVQWLNPGTDRWGPIPYEHRREKKDETGFAKTNIRRCHTCHGVGKHWIPKTGIE